LSKKQNVRRGFVCAGRLSFLRNKIKNLKTAPGSRKDYSHSGTHFSATATFYCFPIVTGLKRASRKAPASLPAQ
jgi:hypothetical protein